MKYIVFMTGKIIVLGKKEKCPDGFFDIDVTSRSTTWGRGMSPFILGPCDCSFPNGRSWNVENAWQYSKVYECHDDNGRPNAEWYEWAMSGFVSKQARRYPMGIKMGKYPKPLYSWYHGKKYGYVEARKKIYIPQYAKCLAKSEAYSHLKAVLEMGINVAMRDFDGYRVDALGISYHDLVECASRPLGHAFVIAMCLNGDIHRYVKEIKC